MRFFGLRVPIHEVEARLVELPYISEAYVVSASFNYVDQIATLVRLKTPETPTSLSKVRGDLQDTLHKYKLPTLLRILHDSEQIPETTTGKPNRKKIAEEYFSLSMEEPLPAGVEFWDGKVQEIGGPRRAWDWGGMRDDIKPSVI